MVLNALYQDAIIAGESARRAVGHGRLARRDGTATVDNPLCGDRVTLDVELGASGCVARVGHVVRGCLLCEAAAVLIAEYAPEREAEDLQRAGAGVDAALKDGTSFPWPALENVRAGARGEEPAPMRRPAVRGAREGARGLLRDARRNIGGGAAYESRLNMDAARPAPTAPIDAGDVSIAVLIPCLDEEAAIAGVVRDFRVVLPSARIYVYDNASTDGTVEAARRAGAIVRSESTRGKGNVVRRMFGDVDADIYVLVDGDDTYPADCAPKMIEALVDGRMDMGSGARNPEQEAAYRPGHQFGNVFITRLVGLVFGQRYADILSGYRILSRRFVKSFPAHSRGFEIETEIAVHAREMRLPCMELEVPYYGRPEGSSSKLKTVRDGVAIVRTIFALIREERPLEFFSHPVRALGAGRDHPCLARLCGVSGYRAGATSADRRPLHGAHLAWLPVSRVRPDSRHRDPKPSRVQTPSLPCPSGTAGPPRPTVGRFRAIVPGSCGGRRAPGDR